MFNSIMKSVFGSANDRYVKSLGKIVDRLCGEAWVQVAISRLERGVVDQPGPEADTSTERSAS